MQEAKLSEVRPLDLLAFNGNSSLDHWELPLLHNRDVHNLDGELQQWNLHKFLYGQDRGHLSLYNDGHITNFVQDLQLQNLHGLLLHDRTMGTCRCTTTGMSGNLIQDLQLWNFHGQLHGLDHGHLSLNNNGHAK